jgi:hypothetical protein
VFLGIPKLSRKRLEEGKKPKHHGQENNYHVMKTDKANFIKCWKRASFGEETIQIVKEARQPTDHYLVIIPSIHKFSQHKLVMFLP